MPPRVPWEKRPRHWMMDGGAYAECGADSRRIRPAVGLDDITCRECLRSLRIMGDITKEQERDILRKGRERND